MRRPALISVLLVVMFGTADAQNGRELAVDVVSSRIYVITHRTGLLSFLGHEHAILATEWQAKACWDEPSHARSQTSFTIQSASLTIDVDSARDLAGLGRGPSASQRAQIEKKMSQSLGVNEFRELSFASDSIRVRNATLTLFGKLTVKGRTNAIEVPFTIRRDGDRLHLRGHSSFKQSNFGVRPESIAGVVKVSDRVDLHIALSSTITSRECR